MQQATREKIMLGGYKMWLDRNKYPCLTIYDAQTSKHGFPVDVMGEGDHIWISCNQLTDTEKKELKNYLLGK